MSPVVSEISSIKNLKFCKECMSIGDLSLYQPVFTFTQFSVAAISVNCYLSQSPSDLNQRWRLQKILPPRRTSHIHRVNRNVCTTGLRLIQLQGSLYRGAEGGGVGGGGWRVARGWRKMSVGEHAHRLFFIPTCLTVDIEASQ